VSAEEIFLTTVLSVAAVTGVTLLLVPHWTAALFVFPLISVLYVDLLGVMQWAGISINPISYIALVMSIGLLVDFILHVLLRFYESHGNRKEKVVSMLKTMGSSIFIGGITTFLGTLPLAFSSSSIFNTIFITFLGLVTLGASHGLILLPVILSLIGPEEHIGAAVTGGVAEGATQKAPKEEEDMERQDDTA
jgi:Niemann-Pick C1 protein